MPLFFIALAFTLFWLGGITANIGLFIPGLGSPSAVR